MDARNLSGSLDVAEAAVERIKPTLDGLAAISRAGGPRAAEAKDAARALGRACRQAGRTAAKSGRIS